MQLSAVQLAALSVHSLSGSVFAAMTPHVPVTPEPFFAAVQATHVPLHAVLQHTPSTQFPVAHWFAAAHTSPCPRLAVHVPPAQ